MPIKKSKAKAHTIPVTALQESMVLACERLFRLSSAIDIANSDVDEFRKTVRNSLQEMRMDMARMRTEFAKMMEELRKGAAR